MLSSGFPLLPAFSDRGELEQPVIKRVMMRKRAELKDLVIAVTDYSVPFR